MDAIAVLTLTVPILLPISAMYDVDPIALGVLMILSQMIGLALFEVSNQDGLGPLLSTPGIQLGLLLMLHQGAAADGELLYRDQAGCRHTGQKHHHQYSKQGDPGLTMSRHRLKIQAVKTGG